MSPGKNIKLYPQKIIMPSETGCRIVSLIAHILAEGTSNTPAINFSQV